VPEICERLALGRRAVYGLLEARIIPAIRVGSRWVIARAAYEQWEKTFGQRNAIAIQ
jgi:excisionase family DNA binding protein